MNINEDKKFHFISGLPRSGSTLLANVLAQNPRFHTTHTSGIADVMFGVRNQWDNLIEFKAHPNEEGKVRVLSGILKNYYEDTDKPIIFDKSRVWVSLFEMAEKALGYKPKIIVPVRDVRDILASFEKLWRKTSSTSQLGQEKDNYVDFQSVEGRCATWMLPHQPVGIAYNRIKDAVVRGFRDQMYFLDFDSFTSNPKKEIEALYTFLGEKHFSHDFNNVEQVTWEDDAVHGIKNLHDIRPKIEGIEPQWPLILGNASEPYANLEFWKKL
jgi:sulfotransferase